MGIGLADTLDSLISSNEITPQLAVRIMERFDIVVCETLSKQVKAKASFKGHLHTYRNCDDVWTFHARFRRLFTGSAGTFLSDPLPPFIGTVFSRWKAMKASLYRSSRLSHVDILTLQIQRKVKPRPPALLQRTRETRNEKHEWSTTNSIVIYSVPIPLVDPVLSVSGRSCVLLL